MDDMTEYLHAGALRAREFDELEIPTDIVNLLHEHGFETVEDALAADQATVGTDVVRGLERAFPGEPESWGVPRDGVERARDAIAHAVAAIFRTYREIHVAEPFPECGFRTFRRGDEVEVRLGNGISIRGSISAPLLLAARYRSACFGPTAHDEFPEMLSLPREAVLEQTIGAALLAAARQFLAEGEHDEAVLCARRALRDVRWILDEEFDPADAELGLDDVPVEIRDDVTRVADCSLALYRGGCDERTTVDVTADCAESPDVVERYETAVAIREMFAALEPSRLRDVCEGYLPSIRTLATDANDAVIERALDAAYLVGASLHRGGFYRQAVEWLEVALDGGVYPGHVMRLLVECRMYTDGEIPSSLQERLARLGAIDEATCRGPYYDEHWLEEAHVRVAEALVERGDFDSAATFADGALHMIGGSDQLRALQLAPRAKSITELVGSDASVPPTRAAAE